ncbi:AAA family ATPase [Actinokineospora pegani]|uniref:AAA family ATPase n=1 Tax=Actinokineospora pegani TaxID=2654637 RepID=UPI0012EA0C95|nr:AAA family ATPase [Actinokineospora pegani]
MIVWINGAFGAGKTTLAEKLHDRLPDVLAFDPEYVGFLLRQWAPGPVADFQDIPLWRKLTAEFAVGLCREYQRPLVVPMTLVNTDYRDEIFDLVSQAGMDLLHVFLDVPRDELRRRIEGQVLVPDDPDRDARTREFRLGNITRCVAASSELPSETLVLRGDLLTPGQLADQVLEAITTRGWHEPAGLCGRGGG